MNNLTRRDFGIKTFALAAGGYLLAGGAVGTSLLTTGCSPSQIANDIKNWVPVGLAAFNSIVAVLESAGVINPIAGAPVTALIGLISAGFGQIIAAAQEYGSIDPPPAGAVAKLKAALGIVVSKFQEFLASINVTDNKLLQLVIGFAQLILGTIAGFENELPATTAKLYGANLVGKQSAVGNHVVFLIPVRTGIQLTRRGFKRDWNSNATQFGHKECEFKLSWLERI